MANLHARYKALRRGGIVKTCCGREFAMIVRQLSHLRHEQGFCWVADLGSDVVIGDSLGGVARSVLRLFENEVELGPPRASHETIRFKGGGAFSHWERVLFFSASDNSNPSSNGRTYRICVPRQEDSLGANISSNGDLSAQPVNYQSDARSVDSVESDAEYALECARSYVGAISGGRNGLREKKVLEIGPGASFATALILKAWGAAMVAVSDRYLVKFDADYHGALYREVATRLLAEDSRTNVKPLEICADRGHIQEQVCFCELPLEDMSREFKSYFDITLSNAVLEHLYNPKQGIAGLYGIMAPHGVGSHQVDFRDHGNFDRPLEYLLLDDTSFANRFKSCHGECGNRVRPFQMKDMFCEAGFSDVLFQSNLDAPADYLAELMPRLRAARSSLFSNIEKKFLIPIGGRFVVRK
jgi:SAM-dependent methyltransferase